MEKMSTGILNFADFATVILNMDLPNFTCRNEAIRYYHSICSDIFTAEELALNVWMHYINWTLSVTINPKISFKKWCCNLQEFATTAERHFAADLRNDPDFPRGSFSLVRALDYLESINAADESKDGCERLWIRWRWMAD